MQEGCEIANLLLGDHRVGLPQHFGSGDGASRVGSFWVRSFQMDFGYLLRGISNLRHFDLLESDGDAANFKIYVNFYDHWTILA